MQSSPSLLTVWNAAHEADLAKIGLTMLGDDFINDSVNLGLFRSHDEIPFHIFFDLFDRLARMEREKLVERITCAENFAGVDVDVSGLTGKPGHPGLVDQNSRVGQGIALFRRARNQ